MNAVSHIPDVTEPWALFGRWFEEAVAREPDVPDAMSIATVNAAGRPSVRMVLLKAHGPDGLVFYTNTNSRKGQDIAANAHAAICLHWKSLGRQIRVEGALSFVTDAESDAYWASRPRASQIAGWASLQSDHLPTVAMLQDRVKEMETRFQGKDVARPPHWRGYRLKPEMIEFWQNLPNRLHERLVFHRADGARWRTERLYP